MSEFKEIHLTSIEMEWFKRFYDDMGDFWDELLQLGEISERPEDFEIIEGRQNVVKIPAKTPDWVGNDLCYRLDEYMGDLIDSSKGENSPQEIQKVRRLRKQLMKKFECLQVK